jgi:Protein of unknown function (DUF3300)
VFDSRYGVAARYRERVISAAILVRVLETSRKQPGETLKTSVPVAFRPPAIRQKRGDMTDRRTALWLQPAQHMNEGPWQRFHVQAKLAHGSKLSVAFVVTATLVLSSVQVGRAADLPQPDMQQVGEAAPGSQGPSEAPQPSPNQLNQLVAPVALYPDALVAQVLAAATYPSEVVEADRWMQQHPGLQGQSLAHAVDPQPWDPSVKALTQFPSVLANMDKNLSWTSSLGEAYANHSQGVLDAVQTMRRRAQQAGTLKSTPQETITAQGPTIVIAPANPQVVYVPAYNPWVVYGPPVAFYPGWVGAPAVVAAGPAIGFGVGIGIGVFAGFSWGWHNWGTDWHGHNVVYNHTTYISHNTTIINRNRTVINQNRTVLNQNRTDVDRNRMDLSQNRTDQGRADQSRADQSRNVASQHTFHASGHESADVGHAGGTRVAEEDRRAPRHEERR